MPEYLGSVAIPEISTSGVFPVVIGYESVRTLDPKIIVHRFGHLEAQAEQRYYQGPGERRFRISLQGLTNAEKASLVSFFESRKGTWQPFTLNIAEPDGTTATYTVRFADPQFTIAKETDFIWSGSVDLVEEPTDTPTFSITTTANRFPGSSLQTALLSQVQECIPLVKVSPGTGSAFYVSDRRVSVGGQLYQPRILDTGGVSQSIDGASDEFTVTLGNADRVLTAIANGYDLWNATVEFSLFHVGTGTKLDLWKGSVIGFDGAAENEFTLHADDGLPLRSDSPKRAILRQDGFVVPEQPVSAGGKKGIASFTATSVTNDTAYGKPLQQIFVNNSEKPLGVDCAVICGRDESEFYAALGVVGQGPISGFYEGADLNFKHSLEGQTNHGPGNLGLRRSYGGNPTTGSETAIDNSPDSGSNSFALDEVGHALPSNPLDGVAFIQIRRSDEKGVQPLRPDARQMRAWITGGLGCWKWSSGTRSWQAACTNPFWIALRQWFERKGVQNADAATQEATFDVAAAEYCAGLADTTVDKIIGTGTEKQFQFTGVIAEAKPTRDWISEIIGNALGYYTVCFGRLKFGIRINASAVESFTVGNLLLDSLKIDGRAPDANHMVVAYADEDYAYAQNALELKDDDFGARAGQPKKKNINLVGCSTKSQAARVCSVLFREMLGGTSLGEWTGARKVELRTTILALNTEPGMVCSVTHTDAPGGVLKFRVSRWRLNRDYSITISGETVTSSMYDLTVGPKPSDVAPDPIPAKNWYDVGVGTNLKYQSLIGNGSFEQGLLGWTVDSLLSAHAELDDVNFWHGTRSLKVTSGATGSATINQPNIAIAGNTSYVFSGFYKRDGLVVDGSLMLAARWIDGAGAPVGTDIEIPITDGTDTDKVQFAVNATSPADAVQVIIYAYQGTHSAGTLNVDGLEFKLFSALAAAASVTSVSASLFYSADATMWGMNSAWVWPGDSTTIKGIERRAYFYSDEAGTVEIGYSDLATLSLDTVTNTAQDGGDWPGYETATYVRSAVRTANGDLEKGEWVMSDPILVDASAETHSGAYDLTMLASPTITTVGDQFKIEGQFLPGYISAGVSRTVGAAFWWEPGVDGSPSKVGESPYDTTKAGQPSPDNQGSYDVWISKASILTITADGSGNRTGYLHGLAIEPNAFIPFKPHPTQASAAELALTFTQEQLDGAIPLEAPNPPTAVLAAITSLNGSEYTANPTWTPPSPAGGTVGYDVEFASMYSVGAPADSAYRARQYVAGVSTAAWKSPAWPKDERPVYQYVRVRGRGADQQVSAWAYSSNYATIDQNIYSTRPEQPTAADWSIVTPLIYSDNQKPELKGYYLWLSVNVTFMRGGSQWEAYYYRGSAPPTNLADAVWFAGGQGVTTQRTWIPISMDTPETIQVCVLNCTPTYNPGIDGATVWKSVTTSPAGTAPACTAQSVVVTPITVDGQKRLDVAVNWTRPASDPLFSQMWIYRIACNSSYVPISGATYDAGGHYVELKPFTFRVNAPPSAEYWKYKFVPVDTYGRPAEANATTANVTFPASSGVDSGALTNLGEGLAKDSAGRVAATSRNDVRNGNFETDGDWDFYNDGTHGAGSIAAGVGAEGSRGARVAAFQAVSQIVTCSPSTWYRFSFVAARNSSVAGSAYIAWFKSDGSLISIGTAISIATNAVHQPYQIVSQSPASATRAQLVPAFIMSAATGYCDVDSVTWDGLPNPGSGQAYDSAGNLISTAGATLKNGEFSIADASGGPKDWFYAGVTLDYAVFDTPPSSAKMTATSGTVFLHGVMEALPGDVHQGRFRCYTASSGVFTVRLRYYNSAGAVTLVGDSKTVAASGSWQTVTVTSTAAAPAGTTLVQLQVFATGNAGAVINVDGAGLNKVTTPTGGLGYDATTGALKALLAAGFTLNSDGKIDFNLDSNRMVVDSNGKLTTLATNVLNDLAIDTSIFSKSGGVLTQNAIATNLLVAALAVITGSLVIGGGTSTITLGSTGTLAIDTPIGFMHFGSNGCAISADGGFINLQSNRVTLLETFIGGTLYIGAWATINNTDGSAEFASVSVGNGATGTFTTVDGKTVTVANGIVTEIA